jgi:hypothetical protein
MSTFSKLAGLAKRQIDKRGGTEVAKQDLKQVGDIVKGKGTLSEKAKRSADALKTPGDGSAPPRGQDPNRP